MNAITECAATAMARYIATAGGGSVAQSDLADYLEQRYGAAAVYTDEISGNRRIQRSVLTRRRYQFPRIEYNRHIQAWEAPEAFAAPPELLTLW